MKKVYAKRCDNCGQDDVCIHDDDSYMFCKNWTRSSHGNSERKRIRFLRSKVEAEKLNETSCVCMTLEDASGEMKRVYVDLAYSIAKDGAVLECECLFEAPATTRNVHIAKKLLLDIKKQFGIEVSF